MNPFPGFSTCVLALALAAGGLAAGTAEAADYLAITLGTGGDDLRGGNDNVHVRVFDNEGRLVGEARNANGLQRLADHTSRTVGIRLPVGVQVADVAAVELETTFTGGVGGDNWNLDSLRVSPQGRPRDVLFEAGGSPLHRFTGESRIRRYTWVTHHCSTNADCDDRQPANGTEFCAGRARGLDQKEVRACRAGTPPACRPGTVYLEAERRCVGTTRDEDGDGSQSLETGGDDCDDQDPGRYPGAPEICDLHGKDEDCDFTTVGSRDADGDGHVDQACFNWGPPPRR